VLDYLFVNGGIAAVDNGIMILENGEWISYEDGLPVREMQLLDEDNILVIMGNGSYSDGIYTFNLDTHEFEILEYIFNPNFLIYNQSTDTYYAGHEYGLMKSQDGANWDIVPFFENKVCLAMIFNENHYTVSTSDYLYYSVNSGSTWSQVFGPYISEFAYVEDNTLYGIFPGFSNSSGLWSSEDYGQDWSVEFYNNLMIDVSIGIMDKIFVGWEEPFAGNQGIGIWNPEIPELNLINEGLGCTEINSIEIFPIINTPSIIVATDNSGYYVTNYFSAEEPLLSSPHNNLFSISPNPFSKSTKFEYQINNDNFTYSESIQISIYNIKGKLVNKLSLQIDGDKVTTCWDGTDIRNQETASGIYFSTLEIDNKIISTNKLVKLK